MKLKAVFLLCAALIIVGCGSDQPKLSSSESAPPTPPGRNESRGLEAADVAGYNGTGIRRSVDKMLNQNDARNAETKKIIDQANEK